MEKSRLDMLPEDCLNLIYRKVFNGCLEEIPQKVNEFNRNNYLKMKYKYDMLSSNEYKEYADLFMNLTDKKVNIEYHKKLIDLLVEEMYENGGENIYDFQVELLELRWDLCTMINKFYRDSDNDSDCDSEDYAYSEYDYDMQDEPEILLNNYAFINSEIIEDSEIDSDSDSDYDDHIESSDCGTDYEVHDSDPWEIQCFKTRLIEKYEEMEQLDGMGAKFWKIQDEINELKDLIRD